MSASVEAEPGALRACMLRMRHLATSPRQLFFKLVVPASAPTGGLW